MKKSRIDLLMRGIGAIDPETHELIGQEEHDAAVERGSVQNLKRMSLLMGFEPTGVEAADLTCDAQAGAPSSPKRWLAEVAFIVMVIGLFIVLFIWLWKVATKLEHAWIQAADLDLYAANVERKVDDHATLSTKRYEDLGNELSMMQDYQEGVHYGLVEQGGFVRNIMGLSMEERASMRTLESANLVAFNTMGAQNYLGMVRQRYRQLGAVDTTDRGGVSEDAEEEESPEEDAVVNEGENTLNELLDMLRIELNNMLAREEFHQASICQSLVLQVLDGIRDGNTQEIRMDLKRRCRDTSG